jgi:NADH:ubiquinone oxidoreductase subunit 6 (subunit J)
VALFGEWWLATVVLGVLLSMAMIGSSYLVRDERLVNLIWDMEGDQ